MFDELPWKIWSEAQYNPRLCCFVHSRVEARKHFTEPQLMNAVFARKHFTEPPLLAESDVPAASGCAKVQPLELDAAPTGRAPAAQASLVIPGAHGPSET